MSGKAQAYAISQLANTGFAVLGSQTAFKLRPDLWATAFDAATAFNEMPRLKAFLQAQSGVALYRLTFVGDDASPTIVAARCGDDLEQRIHWVTGRKVARLDAFEMEAPKITSVATAGGEEIPTYPCTRRTEMLAELGLTEETFSQQSPFATASGQRF